MNRRTFVVNGGTALLGAVVAPHARTRTWSAAPDVTLRISPLTLELAPGKTVRTTAYNDAVPGPLIRLREAIPATIEVINDTDREEFVHWHGLHIPPEADGAMDEGTPPIPAHSHQSYTFTPRPAGTRWYHSHAVAGRDLSRSTYSGQFGFLLVDPSNEPGRYDQEVFVVMHDWGPYIMGGDDGFQSVGYRYASINGRLLGFAEPVRVRQGQRVLLRVLNASASEAHWLALPGHRFTVTALDGNVVPNSASVDQLLLNPGERVDAIIEMNQPGVWILGEPRDHVRDMGLGVVVEYEGRGGQPQWIKPAALNWSYAPFGRDGLSTTAGEPGAERIPLVFRSKFKGHGAFEHWTINDKSYPEMDTIHLREGSRYRLVFDNQSTEDHPVHLHRHTLELAKIAGTATSGILKDVITVPARSVVEAEFTAMNPGKSLFHCHLQDHMDAGFMTLFDYR